MALVALAACDLIYAFDYAPPTQEVSLEAGDAAAPYDQSVDAPPDDRGGADDLASDAPQSGEQPSACDKLFQPTVPNYIFCSETPTTCTFYYHSLSGARSCQDLCGSNTCLKMEDNQNLDDCTPESPNSCSGTSCVCGTTMNDSICTCQK